MCVLANKHCYLICREFSIRYVWEEVFAKSVEDYCDFIAVSLARQQGIYNLYLLLYLRRCWSDVVRCVNETLDGAWISEHPSPQKKECRPAHDMMLLMMMAVWWWLPPMMGSRWRKFYLAYLALIASICEISPPPPWKRCQGFAFHLFFMIIIVCLSCLSSSSWPRKNLFAKVSLFECTDDVSAAGESMSVCTTYYVVD